LKKRECSEVNNFLAEVKEEPKSPPRQDDTEEDFNHFNNDDFLMEEDSLEFIPILDFQDSLVQPPLSDDPSLRLESPDIPNLTMEGIFSDVPATLNSTNEETAEDSGIITTGQQRRRRGRPRTSSKRSLKTLQSACEDDEIKPFFLPLVSISSVKTKKEELEDPDFSPELEPPPLPSDDEKDEDYVPCEKKPAIKKSRRKSNPKSNNRRHWDK